MTSKKKIVVEDYNPTWPLMFQELRQPIWQAISSYALSIEHIGSTSVPNLAAKPIIDMDIVVNDFNNLDQIINGLALLGYEHRGNLGIEGREAFKHPNPKYPHHLYVCHKDAASFKNHITLKNHLLHNPQAVIEYSQLKKELALKFQSDIDSYVEGKTSFITNILALYNFDQEDLASIQKANQNEKNQ